MVIYREYLLAVLRNLFVSLCPSAVFFIIFFIIIIGTFSIYSFICLFIFHFHFLRLRYRSIVLSIIIIIIIICWHQPFITRLPG